jgi:hypothetical protein
MEPAAHSIYPGGTVCHRRIVLRVMFVIASAVIGSAVIEPPSESDVDHLCRSKIAPLITRRRAG